MDRALGWIGELVRYLGSWLPHPLPVIQKIWVVKFRTTTAFMFWDRTWWRRFYWWRAPVPKPEVIGPGLFWYIPALTTIQELIVVPHAYDCAEKPALTADLQQVTVDTTVECRIRNPLRAATKCEPFAAFIEMCAIQECRRYVNSTTLVDLIANLAEAETEETLTVQVQDRLKPYGVQVYGVVMSVGRARTLHHVGKVAVNVSQ